MALDKPAGDILGACPNNFPGFCIDWNRVGRNFGQIASCGKWINERPGARTAKLLNFKSTSLLYHMLCCLSSYRYILWYRIRSLTFLVFCATMVYVPSDIEEPGRSSGLSASGSHQEWLLVPTLPVHY